MKRDLFLLLSLFVTGAAAGTDVLLEDGQVIRGTDVRRQGDVYLIELDSGSVLTIPVSLVRQVRLVEEPADRPEPSSTGLTYAEPEQLAGDFIEPLTAAESQAVFGEPSRFRPSIVDPNWIPRSGFPDVDVLAGSRSSFRESIIDPNWIPRSGFPDEDVLEYGRATFRESIIDSTWGPEDGFERKRSFWRPEGRTEASTGGARQRVTAARTLSNTRVPTRAELEWAKVLEAGGWYRGPASAEGTRFRFRFERRLSRPSSRSAEVRGCAESILPSPGAGQEASPVESEKVDDTRFAQLPIDVFATTIAAGDDRHRAVFTVAGGSCRAISGDLRDLLGVKHTPENTVEHGVQAYNAALGDRIHVELTTDEAKVDYAFAVVSLVDPDVNGHERASLLLVPDAESLRELTDRPAQDCSVSGGKRKKAARQVAKEFTSPSVAREDGGATVEFLTWSSVEGAVVRHTVQLSEDGKVSIDRETVAAHVGDHHDRD